MNYTIRDISDEWSFHTPRILELEQVFGPDAWNEVRLLQQLNWYTKSIFGAFDSNNNLVGYVATERTGWRHDYIWILVVDPITQGNGIGSKLIQSVKDEVKGKRDISLHVRKDNHAAIALYKKLGFYESATQPYRYNDGTDGIMFKIDRKPFFLKRFFKYCINRLSLVIEQLRNTK